MNRHRTLPVLLILALLFNVQANALHAVEHVQHDTFVTASLELHSQDELSDDHHCQWCHAFGGLAPLPSLTSFDRAAQLTSAQFVGRPVLLSPGSTWQPQPIRGPPSLS